MAVEGRKEAKERRKKEEEESRNRRKRKWFTPGEQVLSGKDTKVDGTEVNPNQVDSQQDEKTWRGGTTYRGKSEWRGGEGVELPVVIYEQSQIVNTPSNYGTSDISMGDKDLAPGDSAVDLLER